MDQCEHCVVRGLKAHLPAVPPIREIPFRIRGTTVSLSPDEVDAIVSQIKSTLGKCNSYNFPS